MCGSFPVRAINTYMSTPAQECQTTIRGFGMRAFSIGRESSSAIFSAVGASGESSELS